MQLRRSPDLNLSLEHMLYGDPSEPNNRMLDFMEVYLEKHALHVKPQVHLGRNDDDGVQLTLDEARRLGEALIDMAALGEK